MLRRSKTIALISVAVWMTGCATTEQKANTRAALGGGQEPFVENAKEVATPAILPQTHFAAGRLFEQQKLNAKAIEQYRKAIAVGHDYLPAYHRLAMLLSKTNRHKEAVAVLTRATLIKPGNAVLRNNLGFEYAFLQDWPKAEREVRRAIKIKPDFARAHVNLGMILSRNGQFDQALASFRKVLPESDAHYNLGLMFRAQKRYQDAAWAFNRAVQFNPRFTAAKTQLEQIAPKLALLGIPDAKHARVAFFRPNPEGVFTKDAERLDTAATNTNVFVQGDPSSEAAYGFPRPRTDQVVASADPTEAAFRFDAPAPSASGALTRSDRFHRGQKRQGRFASRSFGGQHSSVGFVAPPLPDGRILAMGTGSHPPSQAASAPPSGPARHASRPRIHHPSEAAFGHSDSRPRTTMAATVVDDQQPLLRIHHASEAKFASPVGRQANARSNRASKRTMSATIVPDFMIGKNKFRAQEERLRKIRNRIRGLERRFSEQQNAEPTGSGFPSEQ